RADADGHRVGHPCARGDARPGTGPGGLVAARRDFRTLRKGTSEILLAEPVAAESPWLPWSCRSSGFDKRRQVSSAARDNFPTRDEINAEAVALPSLCTGGAGRDVGIGVQGVWTWFHDDVILNGGRGRQVTRGWRPRPATARAPGSIHAALWRLATTSSCRSCPRGVPSEPATWRKPNARSSPRRRGHENVARHTPGHRRCPRRS